MDMSIRLLQPSSALPIRVNTLTKTDRNNNRDRNRGMAQELIKYLFCLLLAILLPAQATAKKDFDVFSLDVVFINGTENTSNEDLERNRIIPWVKEASRQYSTKPRLVIHYTIERKKKADGRNLWDLNFDSMKAFNRFMDENFDNYARTETEGHLTILVGKDLCWKNMLGKQKCWGGWANFPHDVNPFNRKKGIWMSESGQKYVLAHELGHFFSLKHTFEPYVGLNKQCNKGFGNKNVFNPDLGHCNSCTGRIAVRTTSNGNQYYVCEQGVSNVMDYCSSVKPDANGNDMPATETLNLCQQERAASQRLQFMTNDGKVNYIRLAGLRGEGACTADADCNADEYCTAGVLDLKRDVCKAKKTLGESCSNKRQCKSDRCNLGKCVESDECQNNADCGAGKYCSDPIAGQRTCKAQLSNGAICTKEDQCLAGRCKSGFCSAENSVAMGGSCRFNDECKLGKCNAPVGGATKGTCVCKTDSDCGKGKWCDAGIDLKVNACRDKLKKGESCGSAMTVGNDHKCKSGKCSGFPKYVCK